MWPRCVVVFGLVATSLVDPLSARAETALTVVSRTGSGFELKSSVAVDGGENGDDEARGISVAADGTVYATGYVTVTGQGRNIWLARFGPSINLEALVTLDGPAGGYDTGVGVAVGNNNDLYVSAIVSDPVEDFNMWFGRFDVSTIFVDDFESGSTGDWPGTNP